MLQTTILLVALLDGTSAFAQSRTATVDLEKVFTNYWKTKQVKQAIDEHGAEIDRTRKEMINTFNNAKTDYQKLLDSANDSAVSSEERDRRKKAAEDKLKDLKDQDETLTEYDRGSRTALDDQIRRTHENIISDIRTVINARAKADGYTMVIDTSAQTVNATPVLLYNVPGENDITEAVIKRSQWAASVDTPKADDAPPAKSGSKK